MEQVHHFQFQIIDPNDLKQRLKEYSETALFRKIKMSEIIKVEESTPSNKTAIKFESENIKIELKVN